MCELLVLSAVLKDLDEESNEKERIEKGNFGIVEGGYTASEKTHLKRCICDIYEMSDEASGCFAMIKLPQSIESFGEFL